MLVLTGCTAVQTNPSNLSVTDSDLGDAASAEDGASLPTDGASLPADGAAVVVADAAPLDGASSHDAGLAIGCSRELVTNGTFENAVISNEPFWTPVGWIDDQWIMDEDPIEGVNHAYQPHSGRFSIHFGGPGYGVMKSWVLLQGLHIPAGTVQLRFSAWVLVGGYPMPYWSDPFSIALVYGASQTHATLLSLTSGDVTEAWTQYSLAMPPPTVDNGANLYIQGALNTNSLGTDFLVDDVSLIADLDAAHCH